MPVADHFLAFSRNCAAKTAGAPVNGEVCEICFGYFATGKTALWRHVRDVHGTDGDGLSCPVPGCGRRFVALAMSAAHAELHAAEFRAGGSSSYACELCGHHMRNRSAFDKHLARKHPEARDAMCGVCFTYAGDVPSLVRHVRERHGGADHPEESGAARVAAGTFGGHKKYGIRCTVCGKRYGNYSNLYEHRKVHGLAAAIASEN